MYYTKYFENNLNIIKITWNEIKVITSIKNITTAMPLLIDFNSRNITDPTALSKLINNYFTSITEKTKDNLKLSTKNYTDYLSDGNTNTFF